jgi:hypothetical protein
LCHADFQGFFADFRLGWQKIPSVAAEIAGCHFDLIPIVFEGNDYGRRINRTIIAPDEKGSYFVLAAGS